MSDTAEPRETRNEYYRDRYRVLKLNGVCVRCKGQPKPGRSYCLSCLDYFSARKPRK